MPVFNSSQEDVLIAALIVGTMLLAAFLSVLVVNSDQARIAEVMAAGTITEGMTRDQVLTVWGDPADVETRGNLTTLWIYRNPFRTVTFKSDGTVGDYVK